MVSAQRVAQRRGPPAADQPLGPPLVVDQNCAAPGRRPQAVSIARLADLTRLAYFTGWASLARRARVRADLACARDSEQMPQVLAAQEW